MADTSKATFSWPTSSWRVLKKMIRAWYTAEDGGGEWTQRTVAKLANLQPSRVSANKAFLQGIGIVQPEGIALTDAGRNLGLGLINENARVTQQALENIVRSNGVLKQLVDIVRGRGTIDRAGFEAEVLLLTRQGKETAGFTTGVSVLEDMLLESGLVEMSDNAFRPIRTEAREEAVVMPKQEEHVKTGHGQGSGNSGLRQIPIPVSAETVWYIEVSPNPDSTDIQKFIEMQRLIFGVQKP